MALSIPPSLDGSLLSHAHAYLDAGMCVLPAIRDAAGKRVALSSWKEFQERRPTQDELEGWFADGASALCIVCGAVSGNVEMLDFDVGGQAFEPWRQAVEDMAPGLFERLVVETTPSGGRHVVFRCKGPVGGNTKLAIKRIETPGPDPVDIGGKRHTPRKEPDGRWFASATLIETRGEGGMFLCAPSDGYRLIQGDLRSVPTITVDERDILLGCAKALDQAPPTVVSGPSGNTPASAGELRPGDDFNARGDVRAVLRKHGWRQTRSGDNEHWARPGKDSGTSATLKDGVFYVFSSNAPPFEPMKGYAPFAVHALLEHHGDWSAAASALRREGYGAPTASSANRPTATTNEDPYGEVPLGQRDPISGRLVLDPRKTLPTAETFVREFHSHPDGRTLVSHHGELYAWRGNRYMRVEDGALKHMLQPWLHGASRYVTLRNGERMLEPFESNPTSVNAALESIRNTVHLDSSVVVPAWLAEASTRPPPFELLPYRSGTLHIPTGQVLAPTPKLFITSALDYDYHPDPEPPERWIKFLEQVFGEDIESVEALQEWFGYFLTTDTRRQKILLIVGPRRSGKGTIGRVLRRMVGTANVAGPTVSSLASLFGLQSLIGRSVAIVSDARFSGEGMAAVVERLLNISGEDAVTVQRKYLEAVEMILPTRFMFLSNELPKLRDASTALAGRFIVLRTQNSFYGHEDPDLTDKLLEELPGILRWGLDGWKRLNERRKFLQPESGLELVQEMEDLGSPTGAFVRERCEIGIGKRVDVDALFGAFQRWSQEQGFEHVPTKASFGRDLLAAAPGVRRRRGSGNSPFYDGIGLAHLTA